MGSDLFFEFEFDIENDVFEGLKTNIIKERLKDIVVYAARSQMGTGSDSSNPNMIPKYKIRCDIDLSCDRVKLSSNCGNMGLETGILLVFFHRLNDDGSLKEKS
jgi:hypothetical protein